MEKLPVSSSNIDNPMDPALEPESQILKLSRHMSFAPSLSVDRDKADKLLQEFKELKGEWGKTRKSGLKFHERPTYLIKQQLQRQPTIDDQASYVRIQHSATSNRELTGFFARISQYCT
jgi:hypothetical protein